VTPLGSGPLVPGAVLSGGGGGQRSEDRAERGGGVGGEPSGEFGGAVGLVDHVQPTLPLRDGVVGFGAVLVEPVGGLHAPLPQPIGRADGGRVQGGGLDTGFTLGVVGGDVVEQVADRPGVLDPDRPVAQGLRGVR
jgi:hypothetical protein